jgi:DNA-binding MarR family transcriptional regulator
MREPQRIATRRRNVRDESAETAFTPKQGQYLSFIYYYSKLNGAAPAEADFARYFGVTPPAVHGMIVKLETDGWIARTSGQARSIRLLVPREQLPDLE